MKKSPIILFFLVVSLHLPCQAWCQKTTVEFFGEKVEVPAPQTFRPFGTLSAENVQSFVSEISADDLQPYLTALVLYKEQHFLDDWLYYQLVRKVAQLLSPKAENYYRYTLYKWWFLTNSGYDAKLTFSGSYLLFYVQSNETVYNIPYRVHDGRQYVCLNYHDYGEIDFTKYAFTEIPLLVNADAKAFSYQVNRMPDFNAADYKDQQVMFEEGNSRYQFRVKINPAIKTLFVNYPVVDYSLQFNIPLSSIAYQSLIPNLKSHIKKMNEKDGIDFLMHFTRYAFLFKPDTEVFGSEKRLSPEQTLLYEYSDCEDRAALFYYLVKEIYNLPMLVLVYPKHVTVAVQFKKPYGNTIVYNGQKYSICEPSPQRYDLRIGQVMPELKKQSYEIAYAYQPK